MFFNAERIGYTFSLSISHEFEQFGSLYVWAPRKYIGRSGTRTRYPQEPRYQWAVHLYLRHILEQLKYTNMYIDLLYLYHKPMWLAYIFDDFLWFDL